MGAWKRDLVAGERKAASEYRLRSGQASRRAAERRSVLRWKARQGEGSRCCPAILIAKAQAVHAGRERRCGSGPLGIFLLRRLSMICLHRTEIPIQPIQDFAHDVL